MVSSREIKSLITNFIKSSKILSIATNTNQKPWIANVFFVSDESLNLYFLSSKESSHAKHIVKNPNAAVSIYDHSSDIGSNVKGVQIFGKVVRLKNLKEIIRSLNLYLKRFPNAKKIDPLSLIEKGLESGFYKFIPNKFKFLDESMKEKYGVKQLELTL